MPDTLAPPPLGTLGPAYAPYLAGASPYYVTGEDHLRLTSFNGLAGVTLALEGRFLDHTGRAVPFAERHVPFTDRLPQTTQHKLGEGFLLNASVRASAGLPRRGQCLVILELVRGLTGALQPLAVLFQGYATASTRLAWPGSPILHGTEDAGVILSLGGTDPAAGVEISELCYTNARWRLLGVDFALVTDVTAPVREVVLTIDDGANIVAEVAAGTSQAASLTRRYSFARGVQRGGPAASTIINAPLPDAYLMEGYRIRTVTTALAAGDNFGAPRLWVEEWIET